MISFYSFYFYPKGKEDNMGTNMGVANNIDIETANNNGEDQLETVNLDFSGKYSMSATSIYVVMNVLLLFIFSLDINLPFLSTSLCIYLSSVNR